MNRLRRFAGWTLFGLCAVLLLSGCPGPTTDDDAEDTTVTTPDTPADKTIELAAGSGPTPRKQAMSRGAEESVVWHNNDDRGHTIRFTDWPFREPQQDIMVEPGQTSKKFHIYKNQEHGLYSYGIFPPVPGDPGLPGAPPPADGSGPPDPPAFEVGD